MISQSSCANILEIQERSSFQIRAIDDSLNRYESPYTSMANSRKVLRRLEAAARKFADSLQEASKPQPGAFLPINEPFFYVQMQTPDAELPAGGWPDHLTYPAAFIAEVRRIEANAKTAAVKLAKEGAPINEAKQALGTALCGHWHMAAREPPRHGNRSDTFFMQFARLAIARSSKKADLEANFSDWIKGAVDQHREWAGVQLTKNN